VGYGCAALVIPPVTRRLTKAAAITALFVLGAVATAILGETFAQGAYLAIGFFLYLMRQGVAICTTTILQEGVADAYRGRVFSFYDMMFNVTYVIGPAIIAGFMPVTGRSPVIVGLVAVGYAVTAGGYWLLSRHSAPNPGDQDAGDPGPASPSPSAQRSSS
jgi:predicted anti-sigma-YlaC factor YlaD